MKNKLEEILFSIRDVAGKPLDIPTAIFVRYYTSKDYVGVSEASISRIERALNKLFEAHFSRDTILHSNFWL